MPTATAIDLVLSPVSLGSALPEGSFDLKVLGVHRAAFNLALVGTGFVASIVGPSNAEEPMAIGLATEFDFRSWLPYKLGSGRLEGTTLDLLDARGKIRVRIIMGGAVRGAATAIPPIGSNGEAWTIAVAELARIQCRKSAELRIDELQGPDGNVGVAHSPLTSAIRALAGAPLPLAPPEAILSRIVGSGPGLTPAGDDFLVGYAAASICASGRERVIGPPTPPVELARALSKAAESTTLLSASMLRLAAAGYFSGPLGLFAEALAENEPARVVTALRRLCTIGHSSGADTATGFLYGLGLLCGPSPGKHAITPKSDKARRTQHAS